MHRPTNLTRGAFVALALVAGAAVASAGSVAAAAAGGQGMNMDIEADTTSICPGDPVNFTLTTRMLGGGPGLQLRNIEAFVSVFPGVTLTSTDPRFVSSSDLDSDTYISFLDVGVDGQNDEEFVWAFTTTFTETTTVTASDEADFVSVDGQGNVTLLGSGGAEDSWTVTVDEALCPPEESTTTTGLDSSGVTTTVQPAGVTTTVARGLPTTGGGSGSMALVAALMAGAGAVTMWLARRRPRLG